MPTILKKKRTIPLIVHRRPLSSRAGCSTSMATTASQPRHAATQNKQDGDCACVDISDDNHVVTMFHNLMSRFLFI